VSATQHLLRGLIEQAGGTGESGYVLRDRRRGALPTRFPPGHVRCRAATEIALRHLSWKGKGAPLIAVMPEALARRIQQAPDLLRRAAEAAGARAVGERRAGGDPERASGWR
jgi:hypothetical protein